MAVFGKQMGPSYRMDFKGPQSTSLVDLDLLVRSCSISYGLSVSVIFKPFFGHIDSVKLTCLINTIILKSKNVFFKIFKAHA